MEEGRIEYAGSLMKYSFDETGNAKSGTIGEMEGEGRGDVERIPREPERDLRRIEGTLSEVQSRPDPDENRQDYIWVTLEDEGPVVDAMSRVRETYPNALHVEHPTRVEVSSLGGLAGDLQTQSEQEVFEEFAAHVTGEQGLSDGHREVLEEAFERLREAEREA